MSVLVALVAAVSAAATCCRLSRTYPSTRHCVCDKSARGKLCKCHSLYQLALGQCFLTLFYPFLSLCQDQTGWLNEQSVHLPFGEIGESEDCQFEYWSRQTSDFKICTCRFVARRSALLGQAKDWLAQCQDNRTERDIRSWCCRPDFPVGQHYKVTMIAHCHKSVPILRCCQDVKQQHVMHRVCICMYMSSKT